MPAATKPRVIPVKMPPTNVPVMSIGDGTSKIKRDVGPWIKTVPMIVVPVNPAGTVTFVIEKVYEKGNAAYWSQPQGSDVTLSTVKNGVNENGSVTS